MKKILIHLLAALLFVAGFFMLAYPVIQSQMFKYGKRQEIADFKTSAAEGTLCIRGAGKTGTQAAQQSQGSELSQTEQSAMSDDGQLLESMRAYNQRIDVEKQTRLKDPWSYRENIFDFESMGLSDDMIGYITIDAMDVEIPLYIGASEANLRQGAAVLTQTSMPVGGENTNCVIAAHRGGYHGDAMFRDIEILQPGDRIEITNLWETLTYEVIKTIVTVPDHLEAVRIVEGEDLVTLVTCHPYGSNNQRYIVYCSRVQPEDEARTALAGEDLEDDADSVDQSSIGSQGIAYESSQPEIYREKIFRMIGFAVFAAGILLVVCRTVFKLIVHKRGISRKKT